MGEHAGDQLWREQAWRSTTEVNGSQLFKRTRLARGGELGVERRHVVRHQAVHPRVRVEVAVAALVPAERNVHVQVPERLRVHTPFIVYRWPRAVSSSRCRSSPARRSLETNSRIRDAIRSSTRAIWRAICATFAPSWLR